MVNRQKIMFIFGTRPEAIKMAPIIRKFQQHGNKFHTVTVVTAQHRDMLDQILNLFQILPDYDLDIMKKNQSIHDVTTRCIKKLSGLISAEKPKIVIVQGDTTTTFAGALVAFYNKVPIAHIEAGLRSHDKFNPFPEEINRKLITTLADLHFAPTATAASNLEREGIPKNRIFVSGNTVIDALLEIVKKRYIFSSPLDKILQKSNGIILVTTHRRESFGEPLKNICRALQTIALKASHFKILFPVHPNPIIRKIVYSFLAHIPNIVLLPPLDYEAFVHIANKSYIILTDSGGIQEEAPSLGKPVLVLRDRTERVEAIETGTAKLVGTNTKRIIKETLNLLYKKKEYDAMAKRANPYGDGKASERIFDIICRQMT